MFFLCFSRFFLWISLVFLFLNSIENPPHKTSKIHPKIHPKTSKIHPKSHQNPDLEGNAFWGGFLSQLCCVLGASWGRLERLLGRLGRVLERLGGVLGRLGRVLGASWGVLGVSWGVFGASWRHLGASWAHVRFLNRFFNDFSMKFHGTCTQKTMKKEPPLQPQCFPAYFGFLR